MDRFEKSERPDRLYPLRAASFIVGLSPAWLRKLHTRGAVDLCRPGGDGGRWYMSESEIARLSDHERWHSWRQFSNLRHSPRADLMAGDPPEPQ